VPRRAAAAARRAPRTRQRRDPRRPRPARESIHLGREPRDTRRDRDRASTCVLPRRPRARNRGDAHHRAKENRMTRPRRVLAALAVAASSLAVLSACSLISFGPPERLDSTPTGERVAPELEPYYSQ